MLPPGLANTEQAKRLYEHGCVTVMDIVQLIYRPIEPQAALQRLRVQPLDYGISMAIGVLGCNRTLQASPWLAPMPTEAGVRVFDTPKGSLNEDCRTAS